MDEVGCVWDDPLQTVFFKLRSEHRQSVRVASYRKERLAHHRGLNQIGVSQQQFGGDPKDVLVGQRWGKTEPALWGH